MSRKMARKHWDHNNHMTYWFGVFWRYYWGSPWEVEDPLITRESIANFFGDY